ncbi:hypothetical protein B0J11DRAFT_20157 [Dendryphion nanum]|uniref:Uncharacterized protein n=1 Tax=Dendryphion nanum TaxID=256645 RepID=A0A9P9EFK0_9PLEO|nr:hypothetical protein B0J11DRAFT_20157 [Dendryphion nanum]
MSTGVCFPQWMAQQQPPLSSLASILRVGLLCIVSRTSPVDPHPEGLVNANLRRTAICTTHCIVILPSTGCTLNQSTTLSAPHLPSRLCPSVGGIVSTELCKSQGRTVSGQGSCLLGPETPDLSTDAARGLALEQEHGPWPYPNLLAQAQNRTAGNAAAIIVSKNRCLHGITCPRRRYQLHQQDD